MALGKNLEQRTFTVYIRLLSNQTFNSHGLFREGYTFFSQHSNSAEKSQPRKYGEGDLEASITLYKMRFMDSIEG